MELISIFIQKHYEFMKDIDELINEYKKMTFICSQIDYSDMRSVKCNNKAVDRMYEIVNLIKKEYAEEGIYRFSKLLDIETDRTNIWAAVQMLEKFTVDSITEEKALNIIKKDAETSIGMQYWLKDYFS